MRKTWTGAALAISAIAWSAPGLADDGRDGPQQCSLRTLDGSYVLAASGFAIPVGGGAVPRAIIEQIDFNGEGSASSPNSIISANGAIVRSVGTTAASYTLDRDCTGLITFANGPTHGIYMAPNGDKGWTIMTAPLPNTPPNVLQGTLTRVWPQKGHDERH
ncbi:hypothetical protein [Variovorax sp. YR216]|uniref:hypothetical protein n=1 Tax=Variovorax sp. YR216 TaxID=1882828 RepID=UPI00089B5C81|nr:hypothetical protein [Variovorax sp. YR216]SEB25579.1 hypothetical protein SAMN05444680_12619 [Variovorax sp. YR216]